MSDLSTFEQIWCRGKAPKRTHFLFVILEKGIDLSDCTSMVLMLFLGGN